MQMVSRREGGMIDAIFSGAIGGVSPFLLRKFYKYGYICIFLIAFTVVAILVVLALCYFHFFGGDSVVKGWDFYLSFDGIVALLSLPLISGVYAIYMKWASPRITWSRAEEAILAAGFVKAKGESCNPEEVRFSKGDMEYVAARRGGRSPTSIKFLQRGVEVYSIDIEE